MAGPPSRRGVSKHAAAITARSSEHKDLARNWVSNRLGFGQQPVGGLDTDEKEDRLGKAVIVSVCVFMS